jgi:hypothetical protein
VLHRNINSQRFTSDLPTLVLKVPATSTAVKSNGCNLADGWRKNGSGAMTCFVGLACLFLHGLQLYAIFLNNVLDLGTQNLLFSSVVMSLGPPRASNPGEFAELVLLLMGPLPEEAGDTWLSRPSELGQVLPLVEQSLRRPKMVLKVLVHCRS